VQAGKARLARKTGKGRGDVSPRENQRYGLRGKIKLAHSWARRGGSNSFAGGGGDVSPSIKTGLEGYGLILARSRARGEVSTGFARRGGDVSPSNCVRILLTLYYTPL